MKYYRLSDEEKSRHPSIYCSASVKAMRSRGFWGKKDRVVRCGEYFYNLSIMIMPQKV